MGGWSVKAEGKESRDSKEDRRSSILGRKGGNRKGSLEVVLE